MAELGKAAKVGALTLAMSAALYGGWQFISREAGTEDGYGVWARLPDVTGVAPRSRVMVSGVQVGVVDRISLDGEWARVDIRMKPEFPLYKDAAIGRRASSLIGESFIVLAPGTEGRPRIPDGGQIENMIEEASIEGIQVQIRDILKDVKGVTNSLNKSVGSDRGQENIERTLANLADVTEQLNEAVKENRVNLRETIKNVNRMSADTRPELAAILKNIRQVTADIRELTGRNTVPVAPAPGAPPPKPGSPAAAGSGKPGAPGAPGTPGAPGGAGTPKTAQKGARRSGELRSALERVNRASANLESLLKHADNVAARVDRGEGTVGRLTKDEKLIDEVEEVVEGVNSIVGGIGRMQTVVGLRTDYNFLANTIKSYVSLRLQPAEDKYYLIEVVNDPRGLTTFEQIDVDTTNPNDPPHYREIRTTTTNSFRFTFQFAKRMGMFTGRFGIRESTGGIGLDLHLLDDRFELRQDFFGFGEQITPRWRVALSYEFIGKLWLLGGVDNIISNERRDYFFGLQLRFNDQDLKSILPFVSLPN